MLLVLAGPDAGYKSEIEQKTRTLKIRDKVLLTGALGEEKNSALRESNVLALSSFSENFSVVAAEAMNVGLPVVVTEGVGLSSLVGEYGAGRVTKKDVDEFASALFEILTEVG